MVRTAGTRVSAGRSSKKVSSKVSTPKPSTSSSKSSGSSTKLPPIPYQETPSWQKPITNFFKSNDIVKQKEDTNGDSHEETEDEAGQRAGPSKKLKLDEESHKSDKSEEADASEDAGENKENTLENATSELECEAGTSKQ